MKISLIHPSRGRALKAYDTFMHWLLCSSLTVKIEHILCLDTDDEQVEMYQQQFTKSLIDISPNKNLVEAANRGAKLATGDIIVLMSDDMFCPYDWDLELIEIFQKQKGILLKTDDGTQPWIVTLPIMDRSFYEHNGYIYHPAYQHMFCDTDLTHKAELENRLYIRNDIQFLHAHYSIGKSAKDDINKKADATWQQGEETYLQRVRDKFDIENCGDIFKLCDAAQPHISWLKNKLK